MKISKILRRTVELMCEKVNERKTVHKTVEHYNLEINNNQNGEWENIFYGTLLLFMWWKWQTTSNAMMTTNAMPLTIRKADQNVMKYTAQKIEDAEIVTFRIQDWYSWLSAYTYSLSKERKQQDALPAVKWWFHS